MDYLKETDRGGLYIRHAVDEAPDNKGIGFHIHDRCEVFLFVSGNAQYLVEGSVYPLERGSLLIMRPGEAHCIRFLSSERDESPPNSHSAESPQTALSAKVTAETNRLRAMRPTQDERKTAASKLRFWNKKWWSWRGLTAFSGSGSRLWGRACQ